MGSWFSYLLGDLLDIFTKFFFFSCAEKYLFVMCLFILFFFFFKQKTAYEISECDWSSDVCFFFFKQKTAYEISECDWSSDVCSSDLTICGSKNKSQAMSSQPPMRAAPNPVLEMRCTASRSEERRVGKECRIGCRS